MRSGDYVVYDGQMYYRMTLDGYKILYKMNGDDVDYSSYVMEHRFVYERHHGVKLERNVSVHHINHDKFDNRPENLLAMSKSEHAKLHALEDGKHIGQRMCIDCGAPISKRGTRCVKCSYKHLNYGKKPPKQDLAMLIETCSNCEIARRFGVSDTAVKKWRKSYGLPSAREQAAARRERKVAANT